MSGPTPTPTPAPAADAKSAAVDAAILAAVQAIQQKALGQGATVPVRSYGKVPMAQAFELLGNVGGGTLTAAGEALGGPLDRTDYLPETDPRAAAALDAARTALFFGEPSAEDVMLLASSGDLGGLLAARKSLFNTFGEGGGSGPSALDYAQFEETKRQNRIANVGSYLAALLGLDAQQQQRAAQQAELARFALPPGTKFYPGGGPTDPAVRSGLIAEQPARTVAIPAASGYDAQIAPVMDQLRALLGA